MAVGQRIDDAFAADIQNADDRGVDTAKVGRGNGVVRPALVHDAANGPREAVARGRIDDDVALLQRASDLANVRHARSPRKSATRTLPQRFVACLFATCLLTNTVHSIATTRCFLEPNGAHHEPHFPDPLPHRIGRDGSGREPVVRYHCGCRAGDVRLGHTRCVNHAADRAGACDDHCSEVGLTLPLAHHWPASCRLKW